MDLSAIQSAVTSLKAATEIAKTLLDAKVASEVQSKVIEIQSALLSAQTAAREATASQLELLDKNRELKEQLRVLNDWGNQTSRYTLVSPWRNGAQVYALVKETAEGEPPHLLCTNCFQLRRKSILTPQSKESWVYLNCPACKASLSTGLRGIGDPKYADDYNKKE